MTHSVAQGVSAAEKARFLAPNEDVFLLSGPEVSVSGLDLKAVTHEPGSHPVVVDLTWSNASDDARPSAEVTFHPISAARRGRGDVVDFSVTLQCRDKGDKDTQFILQLPFQPEAVEDLRFGLIAALSVRCSRSAVLQALALGVAEGNNFLFAHHLPVAPVTHGSTASRLAARPQSPSLQLLIVVKPFEGELTLRFARAFAGQEYSPYVFNPYYEKMAALNGAPDLGRTQEARTEFLHQAEEAMLHHEYRGGQCFLKPCFVDRGPDPRFPMLIGTPNSLSWYTQRPTHNAGFYAHEGYVRPGGVVLDCGAHAGEMSMLFAQVTGPSGKVIAFDPFPQNYLQVEAQASLNNALWISSTRTGVGSRRETVPVELESQQTTGARRAGERASSVYPLAIEPLDDYIDARPDFLKLDVEGAEVGALEGAKRLLRKCRPRIFIEVHPQFIVQFNKSCTDLFEAIPRDIYHVQYNVPGAAAGWHDYSAEAPGLFDGKVGGLVRAFPR